MVGSDGSEISAEAREEVMAIGKEAFVQVVMVLFLLVVLVLVLVVIVMGKEGFLQSPYHCFQILTFYHPSGRD